jgi:tRNA-dihydrouridine synthase
MIGRAAYSNPFLFAAVDREFFGSTAEEVSRRDVVLRMVCRTIFTLCVAWLALQCSQQAQSVAFSQL